MCSVSVNRTYGTYLLVPSSLHLPIIVLGRSSYPAWSLPYLYRGPPHQIVRPWTRQASSLLPTRDRNRSSLSGTRSIAWSWRTSRLPYLSLLPSVQSFTASQPWTPDATLCSSPWYRPMAQCSIGQAAGPGWPVWALISRTVRLYSVCGYAHLRDSQLTNIVNRTACRKGLGARGRLIRERKRARTRADKSPRLESPCHGPCAGHTGHRAVESCWRALNTSMKSRHGSTLTWWVMTLLLLEAVPFDENDEEVDATWEDNDTERHSPENIEQRLLKVVLSCSTVYRYAFTYRRSHFTVWWINDVVWVLTLSSQVGPFEVHRRALWKRMSF